ncbi:hypothetical protein [Aureispira sp. CCB-E]|uniref:hypothetical protein n=1 Tax=Aureispira sp. CCB-E TaxID=3051121 RepID=UPI002868FCD6|nr:hypothetical protein [Aureispira sp. CCB-E]WMX15276.1 hypothetical protein QP953_02685 [Aureispira sp. CCB-E]
MKKTDSAMLGGAIVTLLIFAYGLKAQRGWKYWVFSMLFIPYAGGAIGYALGKDETTTATKEIIPPISI